MVCVNIRKMYKELKQCKSYNLCYNIVFTDTASSIEHHSGSKLYSRTTKECSNRVFSIKTCFFLSQNLMNIK